MVFFAAGVFLALVYLFPFVSSALAREEGTGEPRDLFGPVNFIAFFGLLGVPHLFVLAFDPGARHPDVARTPWITDLEGLVVPYALLTAATFWVTILGVRSSAARALARHVPRLDASRFTPRRCTIGLLIALAGAIALWLWYIQSIGGLRNLWINMALRTLLGAGRGYLTLGYHLLIYFAAVLLIYRLRFDDSTRRKLGVALALVVMTLVMASGGGRTPLLEMIIICFLAHHYGVRRRRRLVTVGTSILGVVLLAFILIVPLFRGSGRFEQYSRHPMMLVEDAVRNATRVAPQFSAFDRTSVMLAYFTVDRMWAGRSWIDLLAAPVPRSLNPRKPPVDDGIYMKEIMEGHVVRPSRPARTMNATSWPMGNLVLYMNFGLPGLLLGSFLSGVALGAAYRYMHLTGFAPVAILFYEVFARMGLAFSVWGLVQLTMMLTLATLFFWGVFGWPRWPGLPVAARGEGGAPVPAGP
jgi:hypothetical protein